MALDEKQKVFRKASKTNPPTLLIWELNRAYQFVPTNGSLAIFENVTMQNQGIFKQKCKFAIKEYLYVGSEW